MSKAFEEAFNMLCGDKIGGGCSREVFECKLVPGCVVKVELHPWGFENIAEWLTWQVVDGTPAQRWFALCRRISPDGKLLIMERTRPAAKSQMPRNVPVWCSDLKLSNWGFEGESKTVVCHDYGSMSAKIFARGVETKLLKKAEWIDG